MQNQGVPAGRTLFEASSSGEKILNDVGFLLMVSARYLPIACIALHNLVSMGSNSNRTGRLTSLALPSCTPSSSNLRAREACRQRKHPLRIRDDAWALWAALP